MTWRLIDVKMLPEDMKVIGYWKFVYGFDIFLNNIPIVKGVTILGFLLHALIHVLMRML